MQGIDWKLYQEDPFYRDLVDRMLENEQEAARLRQQLRAEQAQLDAEAPIDGKECWDTRISSLIGRRLRFVQCSGAPLIRRIRTTLSITGLLPHNPLCNLVPLCRTRKNSVMCSILR